MKSGKKIISQSGFSLLEILVVLGMFVLISGFALVISIDSFRSHNFGSEQELVVGLLQKARSQAMDNIDQTPHGVHFTSSNYSIFEGPTYTSGIDFPVGSGITPSGATDVVFAQLSGQVAGANPPLKIVLKDNTTGKTFNIFINNEGQINY
jgi:prepilin-type N-terminal cleavage/methylation domain-containing protein